MTDNILRDLLARIDGGLAPTGEEAHEAVTLIRSALEAALARAEKAEAELAEVIEANRKWSIKCKAILAERDALQRRLNRITEAASTICCYNYNAEGHFNSQWNADVQKLSDALDAGDETGETGP